VLLLPARLEAMEREQHARGLLSIPRVVALEPPRVRLPRFLREMASARQADRLRFPGRVRLLVLYDPAQYSLARALFARDEDAELWYIPPVRDASGAAAAASAAAGSAAAERESGEFDELARGRATRVLEPAADGTVDDQPLRERLRELGIISPHAFVPGGRTRRR
jgi:hypothetical protein